MLEECESLSTLSEVFDTLNHQPSAQTNNNNASAVSISPSSSSSSLQSRPSSVNASGDGNSSTRSIGLSMNPSALLSFSPSLPSLMSSSSFKSSSQSGDDWSQQFSDETEEKKSTNFNSTSNSTSSLRPEGSSNTTLLIDQADMYKEVFLPVEEEKGVDYKFIVAALTEYIRSLNYCHIPVEPFVNELLINFLVRNNKFYQLHQLLQYHVVSDSVHVACQLLSLESTYPPAYQLALDMLKRLHTYDDILEVLLTKKQLMAVLRFIRSHKSVKVSPARVLETALSAGDMTMFYATYKFFEHRKQLIDCQKYVDKFKEYFESSKLANGK